MDTPDPFLESWRSIFPVVDELVINVGKSDDETFTIGTLIFGEGGAEGWGWAQTA